MLKSCILRAFETHNELDVTGGNEGIQLADFYAGAYRDYLRANLLSDFSLEKCYELIKFHYADSIAETGEIDSH